MKTEVSIQREILRCLRTVPQCWPVKIIAANKRGVPDILCCLNGRFVAFEVKLPGAKTTKLQDAQRERIGHAGGLVYIVTSLDETKTIITNLMDKKNG